MKTHSLPERIDDNFGAPLHRVFELLKVVHSSEGETLYLDYSEAKFTHPFLTAAISGLKEKHGALLQVPSDQFRHSNIQMYMDTVAYPDGLHFIWPYPQNTDEVKQNFELKSFLPILNFPSDLSSESDMFRSILISSFEKLLARQSNLKGEKLISIKFLISEAIDNISEHSQVSTGKIFAQTFPTKLYLICVC